MTHYPDLETFLRLAENVSAVPVYRRLVSDTLTPVSAFCKIDVGGPACLFESVIGGEKVGRYSIVAVEPYQELVARDRDITFRSAAGESSFDECSQPLDELKRLLGQVRVAHLPELP